MNTKSLKELVKTELENMENFRKELASNLSEYTQNILYKEVIITAIDILNKNIEVLKKSDDPEKINKIISGLPALYIAIKNIPVKNKVLFLSEKNEKRLKAIKTIYGKEAYEKGLKITYGVTVYVGWWILGYDTIEELEVKYTDREILEMHDERLRSQGIKIS